MKKLAISLLVVLIVIFILNATRTGAIEKKDFTLALMVDHFNTQFAKLTKSEIDKVSLLLPGKDFENGSKFINQFAAFCRVIVAVDSVISDR